MKKKRHHGELRLILYLTMNTFLGPTHYERTQLWVFIVAIRRGCSLVTAMGIRVRPLPCKVQINRLQLSARPPSLRFLCIPFLPLFRSFCFINFSYFISHSSPIVGYEGHREGQSRGSCKRRGSCPLLLFLAFPFDPSSSLHAHCTSLPLDITIGTSNLE